MELIVTPKHKAEEYFKSFGASHVISICCPGEDHPEFSVGSDRLIKKQFYDICWEPVSEIDKARYFAPPSRDFVADLLTFGGQYTEETRLLSHCWAGISRSSASAIISMIPLLGYKDSVAKVAALEVSSYGIIGKAASMPGSELFCPNVLLIKYADEALGLSGKLIDLVNESFKY